jgi:hypothetical protein
MVNKVNVPLYPPATIDWRAENPRQGVNSLPACLLRTAGRGARRPLLRRVLVMRSFSVTHDGRPNGCTIDVVIRLMMRDIRIRLCARVGRFIASN